MMGGQGSRILAEYCYTQKFQVSQSLLGMNRFAGRHSKDMISGISISVGNESILWKTSFLITCLISASMKV